MPLLNKRPKPTLLSHAVTQEFFLFEPFLILSKDARSPGPCADVAPAARSHCRAASSVAVGSDLANPKTTVDGIVHFEMDSAAHIPTVRVKY